MAVKDKRLNRGMILTELLMVMAVLIICLTSLFGAFSFALKKAGEEKIRVEASLLSQEFLEGARSFRDNSDWAVDGLGTLTNGAVYHLETGGVPAAWQILADEGASGIFTHQLVFYEVRRDASDNIVEAGGVFDPKSKKAIVTVSWPNGQVSLAGLFTDWQ